MPRDRPPGWKVYKKEMSIHTYGDALWEPTPANDTCISIGDVGFIKDGQFHLLFSAGLPVGQRQRGVDVPRTFQQLDVGDPETCEREPGCLHTPTVRQIGDYGGTNGFTHLPEGIFTFELTGNCGAALVTRHPTRRKDSPGGSEAVFEEYVKCHHESWVEFSRDKNLQDIQPILISGFDVTKDFTMVSYLNNPDGPPLEIGNTTSKPMFASTIPPFGGSWCFKHTPHFQEAESVSAGFDQCVFIRYYTMRLKPPLRTPKVIRAGAWPHDLGSDDNKEDSFPKLTVQSDNATITSGGGESEGQRGPIAKGDGSESNIIIPDTLFDSGFDDWDIIADYVFKNSNAASVLLHHRDLMEICSIRRQSERQRSGVQQFERQQSERQGPGRQQCDKFWDLASGQATDTDGLRELLARYKPKIVVNANGVARIAHPALQGLYHLDVSASGFHDQLDSILHSQRYELCVPNLGDSDLMGLVDYLDEALDRLDPSGRASRKCRLELRNICGSNAIIPASCTIPSGLLTVDPDPFARESFGDMYRGIFNKSMVRVKRLRVLDQDDLPAVTKTLCEAAVIWKHLKHPNILPLLGVIIHPPQLVSDGMTGEDLPRYIKKHTGVDLLGLLSDVAKGLSHLHACDVVHGSLKGVNVLVNTIGNSPHARIVCSGAPVVTNHPDSRHSSLRKIAHDTRWSAPEVLKGESISRESDVYAFAITMVEIFTNQAPSSNMSDPLAISTAIAAGRPSRPTHPSCTDDLWSLMQRCWDQNPCLRPSASDVLQILLDLDNPAQERSITRAPAKSLQSVAFDSHASRSTRPVTALRSSLSQRGVPRGALPSHPALQKFIDFDKTVSTFQGQLSDVLYGEEYARCVTELEDKDLKWLVDYLDEALESLPQFSATSRKCLRELRNICESKMILPSSYILSSLLTVGPEPFDAGGSGDVYRGTLDCSDVCVKRVRTYSNDDTDKPKKIFCREAVVWKHLGHPNVVPLLGVTITPPQLISQWMSGGDLLENVKRPEVNRLSLLSDIAAGLCYLHSCNVIHGDLKGNNILVDNYGHARITDFGLTIVVRGPDSIWSVSSPNGHTPRWSAPEVLRDATYSKESDIFSFAMVMIEVFTGAIPFSEKPATAAMFEIMNGERPPRPTHPTFTPGLWTLMQNCWHQEPSLRSAVSEVLSILRGVDCPTWKSLISDALPMHEHISLVAMIFSDLNQVRIVRGLSGDDAQTFIDKIDEVLDGLAPQIHRKCLGYLYETCGRQALIPRSLEIPRCFDPSQNPVLHGLADVWKGQHNSQNVAAHVFRASPGDNAKDIKKRFCREVVTWRALHHPNVLPLLGVTITENWLAVVSKWMSNGNIVEYTKANAHVDRLGLLRDVARGLIYMHDQRVVHGDLKGENILIDDDGHARIAGFSLATVASGPLPIASQPRGEGTIPWMSPELLYPEKFGLKHRRPTLGSDRYAMGMVIYEVLSGQAPFATFRDPEIIVLVLEGKRPERPKGEGGKLFASGVWEKLELCWKEQPDKRPNARQILMGLEGKLCSSDLDGDAESDTDEMLDPNPEARLSPIIDPGGELRGPSQSVRRVRRIVESFKKVFRN